MKKKHRFILYYCLLTLAATVALLLIARQNAGFAEWYAGRIFPLFPHTLGRLFSPLPFSAFELLLVLTGAALMLLILWSIFKLTRGRAGRIRLARVWRALGPRLAAACCTLLLMYTLTCGINYSRAPLAVALSLDARPSSSQELRLLLELLGEEAAC